MKKEMVVLKSQNDNFFFVLVKTGKVSVCIEFCLQLRHEVDPEPSPRQSECVDTNAMHHGVSDFCAHVSFDGVQVQHELLACLAASTTVT